MFMVLKRLFWRLMPLPSDPIARETEMMRRAGLVLDHYHDGQRPTVRGVRIARQILCRHPLPTHALRSMVRERDQELCGQSQRAMAELKSEMAIRELGT